MQRLILGKLFDFAQLANLPTKSALKSCTDHEHDFIEGCAFALAGFCRCAFVVRSMVGEN